MSLQVYPDVRGIAFPVKRSREWDNLKQRGSSGREVRLSYWVNPLNHWELTYNYLKDNQGDLIPGYSDTDLVTIQGFYDQMGGSFQVFLYDDVTPGTEPGTGPWDSVQGQPIGTGDGITTVWPLIRTIGGFTETIQAPYTTPPPAVYANGSPLGYGTDYTVDPLGNINFAIAPAGGVVITSDFSYYWPVRFDDDNLEFEEVMYQLWALKTVKLVQCRL